MAKKKDTDDAPVKDDWSEPLSDGMFTIRFRRLGYNPYFALVPTRGPSFTVELSYSGKSMTLPLSLKTGTPTLDGVLGYLTGTPIATVEKTTLESYATGHKDLYTRKAYEFQWRHYRSLADAFKGLIGEGMYKAMLS